VVHLSDLLQRRTALAFSGASPETVAEVARVVAPELGWDEDRIEREVASRR
jgi:glycerol-3-phosphate dehydrogenase